MKKQVGSTWVVLIAAFALFAGATAATAQSSDDPAQVPAAESRADIGDAALLEAFVDGIIEAGMREHNVAGAVIAITKDDGMLLSKGYGFADVAQKIPVDPETTMFRIGSVSKLFTWTALMQLHEQGKLDLDRDVNDYLTSLQIPASYSQPITTANLMTHTGGLEDRIIGLFSLDPESIKPYGEILSSDLPERVRPPGWVSSYSNHGVGVAGALVEDVSGLSWPEYVAQNILEPLDMNHSTAFQPLPEDLVAHMSNGYRYEAGKHAEKGFEFIPLGAAGGISASAVDMSKFAMAHLNQGAIPGGRILRQETAKQMHSPLFQPYSELNGWLHGFVDYTSNNTFMLGHNGGTFWFFTEFVLIPQENVSIFLSTNTAGGGAVNGAVFRGLRDRYFPVEVVLPAGPEQGVDLKLLSGSYATFRHPVTTVGKLLRAAGTINVTATDDGQLMVAGLGSNPTYWQESASGFFQNVDSGRKMKFVLDEQGTRLFVGSAGGSFYKLTGIHQPAIQYTVLGSSLVILGWVLLAWPVQKLRRKQPVAKNLHRSRSTGWGFALTIFVFLVGLGLNVSDEIVYGLTGAVTFLLFLPYFAVVLLALQIWLLLPLVRDDTITWSVRGFHLSVTVSAIAVCTLLSYWNLFG